MKFGKGKEISTPPPSLPPHCLEKESPVHRNSSLLSSESVEYKREEKHGHNYLGLIPPYYYPKSKPKNKNTFLRPMNY
jgi:hypothetical protein